mgnify:CR=1 FL=1
MVRGTGGGVCCDGRSFTPANRVFLEGKKTQKRVVEKMHTPNRGKTQQHKKAIKTNRNKKKTVKQAKEKGTSHKSTQRTQTQHTALVVAR